MSAPIRVRFAPAPTGAMHLGNIRTALMNVLYARQKGGTFVLRIEDTDADRNFDPHAQAIKQDLVWLGLTYDEGPEKPGTCGPYYQSERSSLYQENLDRLRANDAIYPCFCSEEELEKKRERQRTLKLPPRYDRTCDAITAAQRAARLAQGEPHVWRMRLDHAQKVSIQDLGHATINFDLSHFSDFPLTRQDGSFTFLFANFVDDMLMKISHVFRGEEHLSNTACQASLYNAFNIPLPTFWHMPLLCNLDGKKLSKRDFGFSLRDLQKEGFLPEAICNYLAIIGGSFAQEVMSVPELVHALDFDHMQSTGHIKYDPEKLKWVNKQWIAKLSSEDLAKRCRPFLEQTYGTLSLADDQIASMINLVKTDLVTLADISTALGFYFKKPELTREHLTGALDAQLFPALKSLISTHAENMQDGEQFVADAKKAADAQKIPTKQLYWFLRLALMDSTNGPRIPDLISILGVEQARARIVQAAECL